MTTKYQLKSLSAKNCAVEIHSKMQEFQLKTHRLSILFHQKTKKKHGQKNNRKKNCFFTSLVMHRGVRKISKRRKEGSRGKDKTQLRI